MAAARPLRDTLSDDDSNPIYKLETVPPPAGEDDAYNATTMVGAMAPVYVEQLRREAEHIHGNDARPVPVSEVRSLRVRKPAPPPLPPTARRRAEQRSDPEAIAVVFDEEDEGDGDDLAPTALFGAPARGPTVRMQSNIVRSVIEQVEARRIASLPVRCDAPWTKASTLPASVFGRVPPPEAPALAPLLEPSPVVPPRKRMSRAEGLMFGLSFVAVLVPALYLYWLSM